MYYITCSTYDVQRFLMNWDFTHISTELIVEECLHPLPCEFNGNLFTVGSVYPVNQSWKIPNGSVLSYWSLNQTHCESVWFKIVFSHFRQSYCLPIFFFHKLCHRTMWTCCLHFYFKILWFSRDSSVNDIFSRIWKLSIKHHNEALRHIKVLPIGTDKRLRTHTMIFFFFIISRQWIVF